MIRIARLIQNYLVFSFPLVIVMMVWGAVQPKRDEASLLVRVLWEGLAWNLMTWFALLVVYLLSMVFIPAIRHHSLKRLANLKDRDEREQLITGQAAAAAYISSLSLLIFLLFLSIFTFRLSRIPVEQTVNGKTKDLSINMQFNLLDDPRVEYSTSGETLVESNDIPLSKTSIILILIVWQMLSFNLHARKQIRHHLSDTMR